MKNTIILATLAFSLFLVSPLKAQYYNNYNYGSSPYYSNYGSYGSNGSYGNYYGSYNNPYYNYVAPNFNSNLGVSDKIGLGVGNAFNLGFEIADRAAQNKAIEKNFKEREAQLEAQKSFLNFKQGLTSKTNPQGGAHQVTLEDVDKID
ncbi:MAG: hypothetical protein KDK66_01870 [Deltaproteobacteria bacterium]|nr:hypothetical protein [Deltaproteobacteria bacterium]